MEKGELDNLTAEGLTAKIKEMKQEYFAMQSAVLSGKEKNSAQLRGMRRDIARAMTALGQKKAAELA